MRDERSRRFRIGLVLAYAVLTVWAQAGDHHGHESAARAECDAACRDPRPHYSGHPSPDLDRAATDCPACQLRGNVLAPPPATPAPGGQIVDRADVPDPVAPTVLVAGLPDCRAPPLA